MKDLMGQAIWDYYHDNSPEDIQTETSISELDELPVEYLFRDFDGMNLLEQKALELAKGKVLDVGSGAGSHSLYLQNEKNLDVTALDVSPKSIEICKLRGVQKTVCENLLNYSPEEKFDTILLLMNGTGIFQTMDQIDIYLNKLSSLLNPEGKILIDGTDLLYMYQNQDGNFSIPIANYYGEVDYYLYYKGQKEIPFKWLYLDYLLLSDFAEKQNLKTDLILKEGDAYLAEIRVR